MEFIWLIQVFLLLNKANFISSNSQEIINILRLRIKYIFIITNIQQKLIKKNNIEPEPIVNFSYLSSRLKKFT